MHRENATSYVIDGDAAVRHAVARLLQSVGYRVVGFEDGHAFLQQATSAMAFGCVILDLHTPGTCGLMVYREMLDRGLRHPVIAMTSNATFDLAIRMMKAGACDVVQKPINELALLKAAATAIDRRNEPREDIVAAQRIAALSPRQMDVLDGLMIGAQNKVIALRLGISPRTVEIHRANLMSRLQVRSLPEMIRLAMSAGIRPSDVTAPPSEENASERPDLAG